MGFYTTYKLIGFVGVAIKWVPRAVFPLELKLFKILLSTVNNGLCYNKGCFVAL